MQKEQIENNIKELVDLVAEGKPMEAFEKFYADNIKKEDLDGEIIVGNKANTKVGKEL